MADNLTYPMGVNSTMNYEHLTNTFLLIHDLVLTFLGIGIVCANSVVISIFCTSKRTRVRSSANALLFNQALVDIFQGSITNGVTLFAEREFVLKQIIYQFSIALSLHTVVLVSIERYIFIRRPLHHKKIVTKSRMRIAVALTWLSSLIWIPFRMAHFLNPQIDVQSYVTYYIAVSNFIICVLILGMTYIHMSTYVAVKSFLRGRYDRMSHSNHYETLIAQRRMKICENRKVLRVTKIFISMFFAFILSYLPLFITGIVHIVQISGTFTHIELCFMSLDLIFFLCNCLFNPLITLTYKEDYRRIYRMYRKAVLAFLCSAFTHKNTRTDVAEEYIMSGVVRINVSLDDASSVKRMHSPASDIQNLRCITKNLLAI